MVDTGSLFSAITEREATLMGLDSFRLPESRIPAIGFGGKFKTKMINRLVILTFREGENEYRIRYSRGFRVICPPLKIKKEEREELLRHTPNVLGMEILTKFETRINKKRGLVELTLIP